MKLHVRTWGEGDKVALLVHGLFSDSTNWHRVGPALAQRGYRVLAPDLRGHGESPRGRYSIVDWSLDLLETIDDVPDLAIGHSLGGLVLAIVAKPLSARSAIYLDPAWRMSAEQDARFLAEWSRWLQWTSIDQQRERLGDRWPEEDLQLRWASMRIADPAIVPGLAAGGGYDHSPEDSMVPSHVVAADPSDFIPPGHADVLRERGLVVRTVAGSGHSVFREDFETFMGVIDEWIASS